MRTTLDLDEKLLKEAMKRVKAKTKTEVVERGLQELIQAARRQQLAWMRGKGYGMTLKSFLHARQDE